MKIDFNEIFSAEAFDEAAQGIKAELEAGGDSKAAKALEALGGSKISSALSDKMQEQDLLVVFAEGWAMAKELRDHKDPKKYPPETPSFVKLGSFKQVVDFHPEFTFSAMGVESKPVKLTLSVTGQFEAVELTVLNAHVTEAGGGKCKLSFDLKAGGVRFPKKIEALDYPIPGRKKFPKPIPIK